MSCLGVHFALTEVQVSKLRATEDESKRLEYVQGIEEEFLSGDKLHAAESDKSWDALHRLMSDGSLDWDGGQYPLNHVVLAGELLCTGDDYIMSLKTPEQVDDIADALGGIDSDEFRSRYYRIDADDYDADLSDDDLEYTWSWFNGIRDLYSRAAEEGRYVLFTADQ
ncbi:MAG: YfbM family protein [Pseudomonadota bacterium]